MPIVLDRDYFRNIFYESELDPRDLSTNANGPSQHGNSVAPLRSVLMSGAECDDWWKNFEVNEASALDTETSVPKTLLDCQCLFRVSYSQSATCAICVVMF